jgi:hypothetical protein
VRARAAVVAAGLVAVLAGCGGHHYSYREQTAFDTGKEACGGVTDTSDDFIVTYLAFSQGSYFTDASDGEQTAMIAGCKAAGK